MTQKVFLIHGWEGSPDGNWLPWLKDKLEKQGAEVKSLSMPNSDNPVMSEWLQHLSSVIGKPDENTYLVGHSLGGITVLRYLESLNEGVEIGGALVVSGFSQSIGINEIKSFFEKSLDYEEVKKHSKKIIAINSDNDKYVSINQGEIMRDKLGAELVVINNGDHLTSEKGYEEILLAMAKLFDI